MTRSNKQKHSACSIFFPASSSCLYANPLSALSAASGRGRMEVCAFLLELGPNLETANRRGMVPLLSATKHGHTQVSVLLCPLPSTILPKGHFPLIRHERDVVRKIDPW